MDIQAFFMEMVVPYLGRIVLALVAFIVGRWLIGKLLNLIGNRLTKNFDETLESFLSSFIKVLLYAVILIVIASTLGLEMTSFVALLGAAGLAVGLALQGSLANFAGGVLLLAFRPIEVGDFIETSDHKGKVSSIQILFTILTTRDNKEVIIPNGKLANNSITNYTKSSTRRVELSIGISYDDDIIKAKEVLRQIVESHDLIHKEPEPLIRVAEHANSSININVFVWADNANYWDVYYDLMEEIKIEFDRKDITFPFPQRDVHLFQIN